MISLICSKVIRTGKGKTNLRKGGSHRVKRRGGDYTQGGQFFSIFMLMQKLWVILALFLSLDLCSQDHFNRIIPFEFGNPNAIEILNYNGCYLIPVIYFPFAGGDQSTIIRVDKNEKVFYHHYLNYDFSPRALKAIGENVYTYGENRQIPHDLKASVFDDQWRLANTKQISSQGDWSYVLASSVLNDELYHLYGYEDGNNRIFGLNKMTKDLDHIWTREYDVNAAYGLAWTLEPTKDGNLLIGYTAEEGYAMQVDTAGEVLWTSDAFEDTHGGATKVSVIELSNGNILANYRKDMWSDLDFSCCYVPFTPSFVLMNNQGQRIHEKLLHIDQSENVYYANFEAGGGDYYFGYGQKIFYDDDNGADNFYGFITKFDNNGDTIWNKYYRHPDFDQSKISYLIRDIIENENGTIVAMGKISFLDAKNEVWLFSVDADGCFTADNCGEEIQIQTSSTEVAWDEGEVFVYPNPTSGLLHISPPDQELIVKVEVYTTAGQLAFSSPNSSQSIDISSLNAGAYQVRVYLESGAVASQQVVLH